MRPALLLALALGLALAPASSPFAEDGAPTTEALAEELIRVTGGAAMTQQTMRTFVAQIRPAFPTVPDELWEELIASLDADEYVALVVPIYTKHYTREDLAALIEFYGSPLGQRLIETNGAVMQESMAVGAAWGQQKAAEIIEKLRARGYEPVGA